MNETHRDNPRKLFHRIQLRQKKSRNKEEEEIEEEKEEITPCTAMDQGKVITLHWFTPCQTCPVCVSFVQSVYESFSANRAPLLNVASARMQLIFTFWGEPGDLLYCYKSPF